MTKRTATALSLACVLTAGMTAGGCAKQKKDGQKVPMDRGVTDLAPGKAVPASAVPPDPSYVYMPAAASQPKFVPVDAPAAVPASDPMAGLSAAPAPAAPVAAAPVLTRTPAAPAVPAAASPAGLAKQYQVQKGDTLFRIAKTHYGDGNRWQQIAMVNPGLTPATLKAGSTIVVP